MSMTLKELKNRISSARNIQQITRAMKLIAAAKIRKLEAQLKRYKRFLDELRGLLSEVSSNSELLMGELSHVVEPLQPEAPVMIVVMTADRGLCGAFNANIINLAYKRIEQLSEEGKEVVLYLVGRKAEHSLSKLASKEGLMIHGSISRVPDYPPLKLAVDLSETLIDSFTSGEVSAVEVITSKYISVTRNEPVSYRYLPIDVTEFLSEGRSELYLIEPAPEEVISQLLMTYLHSQLYGLLLELKASEFAARLVAMTNATENAANLIKELMLEFFKKRQELITKELMDIVEAAEGLKSIS